MTMSGSRIGRPPGTMRRVEPGTALHTELMVRLKRIMHRRGLTNKSLATLMGVKESAVSTSFLRGRTMAGWKKIADAIQRFDRKHLN